MTRGKLLVVVAAVVAGALVVGGLVVGGLSLKAGASADTRWVPARATASQPTTGPRPERLRIASIGVDTPLEDLTLNADGTLHPPTDFEHAGWYAQGTSPGDVGPAVIAGHVDSKTGPAVFFRLRDLRQGDIVEVTRAGAQVKFKVLAVRKYPKAQFPTDEVYAPTPNAQLRLITCGGTFDRNRRSYVDNIVVYAVAV
jgi:LPXTG-site transpeptidase (sortase) family protein